MEGETARPGPGVKPRHGIPGGTRSRRTQRWRRRGGPRTPESVGWLPRLRQARYVFGEHLPKWDVTRRHEPWRLWTAAASRTRRRFSFGRWLGKGRLWPSESAVASDLPAQSKMSRADERLARKSLVSRWKSTK